MTNNNLLYYLNENNLPSGVTLRNATKDDTDNMFKWEMESVDKSIRNDPKTIRYIKKDVQESIKLTKMIMYNGETIGMFTTDRLEPGSDWWYIGEIYIVKEHRNKGIGTALLKEEISKHDKIKLMVSYSNTSAMKLYKSLGFEVTDKNDKGGMYIMSLDKTKSKSVNEACKDLKSAREFVSKVGELAKKYNANYFIVTDGASGIHNDGNPAVKNARDSQIKWEKEHGFDPDEDWSKESVNETMELYLTRPKYLFKKNITLYHGTNKKIPNKVIDPKYGTINAGTRLSNPRYSTWWTDDEFFALTIDIYDIFMKEYDIPSAYVAYEFINIDYRNKIIYINKDNANQVKNLLNKSEKYVYIATVPTSIVGRGHNYNIDEYTIDVPIKADKEIKVTYDILKPYIKIISKEEFQTSDMIKNHILVHNANNKLNAIELLIYKDDFGYIRQYNKFLSQLGEFNEHVSILNEIKQFPIEFDKEGNLIIYKSRIGSLAFGDEIDDSVQLLQVYRNSSNIEGMKYELAKLWYINDCIEKKLKKRLSNDEYKELIDTRATCLNVFKTNLDYVMKTEKGFNFSDYYNSTPFSDNSVKITANTLKYAAKTIAGMI